MQRLQLTLAIIKPHAIKNPVALTRIRHVLKSQFVVIKSRRLHMTREIAGNFYAEHRNKFFYNRLVTFMSSGCVDVHCVCGADAVRRWRATLGPTAVTRAQYTAPGTLRALFGLSDTRNVAHGSDSDSAAHREIQFFFPEFSWSEWRESEPRYRCGRLMFDNAHFHHLPLAETCSTFKL